MQSSDRNTKRLRFSQSSDRTSEEAQYIRSLQNWTRLLRQFRTERLTNEVLTIGYTSLPWHKFELIQKNVEILESAIHKSQISSHRGSRQTRD